MLPAAVKNKIEQIWLDVIAGGVSQPTEPGFGEVTMPYEFLPVPKVGDKGIALGRNGKEVCKAEVTKVRTAPAFDHTNLLTIKVPNDMVMKARFYKKEA